MMTQALTFDLVVVSLLVLLLVLVVLLLVCWILRRSRSRNLTELQISSGQPPRVLIIRAKPDDTLQLLDHLLDRVFLQGEPTLESGGEPGAEPGEEPRGEPGAEPGGEPGAEPGEGPRGEHRSYSGSDPEVFTVAPSHPITDTPSSSPHPPTPIQDQANDLGPLQLDESQHASLSSQGASCSARSKEESQHDYSQV
uniref:guanine nucleotide-binding protein G(s) subunit alpha isoforms XLas-like n=1 Tax=Monopterus albus TaxID=43700 RepID=UPI0009B4AF05|nr:guanine nucleotide-binding protein G(s) subunit alpha isoforms XLas-like [Monopterus albus]XP_020466778.1 guanine nucleotide-binding protein G(s) subunit alpha isoforms XLas-like [Monopterus albus]XP_020466779.1 guanine nucleotide-binding protein G(s) subunit alpha isoforms XLas-like [Monopterus albus]